MTAVEKVEAAMREWVKYTDPPPIGMDVAQWIVIVLQYCPVEITFEEINEAGAEHWGESWKPIKEPEVGEGSKYPWTPIKDYDGNNDPF